MKESLTPISKAKVTVRSMRLMTEAEERQFLISLDALLSQQVDRSEHVTQRGDEYVRKSRHNEYALRRP